MTLNRHELKRSLQKKVFSLEGKIRIPKWPYNLSRVIKTLNCVLIQWSFLACFVFHSRPLDFPMGIFLSVFHKLCVHLRVHITIP